MNAGIPKQFMLLAGKPLLMHSIQAFSNALPGINVVIALPADQFIIWEELCRQYEFNLPCLLTSGGETRFHTVQKALSILPDEGLVAIHDGARPLITETLILSAFRSAEAMGNCIPVTPVTESLRMLTEKESRPVDRTLYCMVQTPQVFQTANIKKAYDQPFNERFTDDATVAENMGELIHVIKGDPVNIKMTYPNDIDLAEMLYKRLYL
jgi:2-C-methyl-D-erythritol 4-phosphate cytidylyltransferase